jgi:hypothetical protein
LEVERDPVLSGGRLEMPGTISGKLPEPPGTRRLPSSNFLTLFRPWLKVNLFLSGELSTTPTNLPLSYSTTLVVVSRLFLHTILAPNGSLFMD